MSHKTEDFKLSAVTFYLKNKDKLRKTCKVFGCTKSSLQRWVQLYKTQKNPLICLFIQKLIIVLRTCLFVDIYYKPIHNI